MPESLGRELLALFCPGDEKIIEDCNEEVGILYNTKPADGAVENSKYSTT